VLKLPQKAILFDTGGDGSILVFKKHYNNNYIKCGVGKEITIKE